MSSMKRPLCLALMLALLLAMCLPAALAEEDAPATDVEIVAADGAAGDTGLTVEGAEETPAIEQAPAVEETPDETAPEQTAPVEEAPAEDEGEQAVAAAEVAARPATGIRFSADTVTVGVKETYSLTVATQPKGSALPALTWRSENEKYAKVDANGAVTGVRKGTVKIYAKMDGAEEIACTVKVLSAPRKLNLKPTRLTLGSDGCTAQLTFTLPKGTHSNTFTFASSNPKVATVDQTGKITTVGPGRANITVKAFNGRGGKCRLTVLSAPTAVAFPSPSLSIAIGQKLKLDASVTFGARKHADAGLVYAISPNSRDAGCVSLNASTGQITGVRKGSCVITATTYNGKTATLPVTVAVAPTAITLNAHTGTIGVKDTYSGLLADLTIPAGEKQVASTITWTTSNKRVATVDANGVIRGVRKGSCVITATTVNGLKDSCKITVRKAPKKITITPAKASLTVGETDRFTVLFPKNTAGTVTFDTSDHSIATIEPNGQVHALKAGTVTVTAVAYNNKKATATLVVYAAGQVSLPGDEYSPPVDYDDPKTNAQKLEKVIYNAYTQLGKPYIYGSGYNESNPRGFDCSGLVYWSFRTVGVKLQATAHRQGYDETYQKMTNIASLKRGDLVCFNTVEDGDDDLCDHSGIYLGGGKFIHASSSAKEVVVSTLSSGYYNRNFSWGRRILP